MTCGTKSRGAERKRGFYLANESAHRHVKRRVFRESDRPSAFELIDCKGCGAEALLTGQLLCLC